MKKNLLLIGTAALIVTGGSSVLAMQPARQTAPVDKPAASLSTTTETEPTPAPTTTPVPAPSSTVIEEIIIETPRTPDAPTVQDPTVEPTVARSYEELVEAYNFKGEHNTTALEALRAIFPERFTPETIEHTFRYLRNIGSSIDHRFVRTYGWDLPQYQ